LGDVKEYQNLLEPSEKLKKSNDILELKKIVDIATKLATLRIIAIGIWKTPITN
jgi:hypothetical protein